MYCFVDTCSSTPTNVTDCNPCGIAGKWVNDLGSKAEFSCKNGFLSGKYNSKVGKAEDYYLLSGRYTMVGPGHKDAVVGWSVAWNNKEFGNSNSTSSFTGVYYASNETIYTTWILTRYTSFADRWSNSRVGFNVFTRQ